MTRPRISSPTAYVFIAFACLYLITVSGHYGGDGFESYLTAESLVLDGDLAIHDRPFPVPELARGARVSGAQGASGREYSKYGIGLPLAEAPFYAAGRLAWTVAHAVGFRRPADYVTMAAVSTLNAFVTAGLATLLFARARRNGLFGWDALLAPLAFGVGSFAWVNARLGFAEPLFTLAAFGAVALSERRAPAAAWVAGALAAVLLHIKAYGIAMAPLLVVYLVARAPAGDRRRRAAAAVIPLLVSIGILAWLNVARFGDVFATGYDVSVGGPGSERFTLAALPAGVAGLVASPSFGLIWYAPITVALALGWRRLAGEARGLSALAATWTGAHLLLFGSYTIWYGGFAWGPRYLYPVLPFLMLPLAYRASMEAIGRRVAWALVGIGACVQLPPLVINFSRYMERFDAAGYPHWDVGSSPILGNWRLLVAGSSDPTEPLLDTWFTTLPSLVGGTSAAVVAGAVVGVLLAACAFGLHRAVSAPSDTSTQQLTAD